MANKSSNESNFLIIDVFYFFICTMIHALLVKYWRRDSVVLKKGYVCSNAESLIERLFSPALAHLFLILGNTVLTQYYAYSSVWRCNSCTVGSFAIYIFIFFIVRLTITQEGLSAFFKEVIVFSTFLAHRITHLLRDLRF